MLEIARFPECGGALGPLLKCHLNDAEARRAVAWAGALVPERLEYLPGPPRLPCELGLPRGRLDPDLSVVPATLIWSLTAKRWERIGRRQPVMSREEIPSSLCRGASERERG
jgi:hypothetical protein